MSETVLKLIDGAILRTKLSRDGAVGAKLVEIRVRFNRGKV